jgi:hypothetical protein
MKILPKIFYVLGFLLEYVVPICLFGIVTPLVHGKLDEGLTTVGIIAVVILGFIMLGKIKKAVKEWKKGLCRAFILAFIKAIPLFVVAIFLHWLAPFVNTLLTYMWSIIPIFIVGCAFDLVAEYLDSKEEA